MQFFFLLVCRFGNFVYLCTRNGNEMLSASCGDGVRALLRIKRSGRQLWKLQTGFPAMVP